jgi:hypothetical protein
MNWDAIGAIGEILGALAVLVTLFYLALQVRHHTRATKRTAFQELMNYYGSISDYLSTPEGAELIGKSRHGLENLDETDRIRILNLTGKQFAHLQNVLQQRTEGFIDESQWIQLSSISVAIMSSQSSRAVWELTKERYSVEFQEWIEGIEVDVEYVSKMEEHLHPQE